VSAEEEVAVDETVLGRVTNHCSDDDGVPDVGISLGLGSGSALWLGELLKDDGGDIGFVFHGPDRVRIAAAIWPACEWRDVAELLSNHVAPLLARLTSTTPTGERGGRALFEHEMRQRGITGEDADWANVDSDERALWTASANAVLSAAPASPIPTSVANEDKGNHDCLAKRRPDEPMFILLGRDPDAWQIVRAWANRRLAAGGDPEHCMMGLRTANAMRDYAADPANRPASAPPADAYPRLSASVNGAGEREACAVIRAALDVCHGATDECRADGEVLVNGSDLAALNAALDAIDADNLGLDETGKTALASVVRVQAYNSADPLAIRLEFTSEADRLSAANEIDNVLARAALSPALDNTAVEVDADWMEEARKAAASARVGLPWAKRVMAGHCDEEPEVRAAMHAIAAVRDIYASAALTKTEKVHG